MKTPSLNPAAIGGFFLRHGEKLVFAGCAAFALLLAWWGIDAVRSQAVTADRTPDAVTSLAGQATANVDGVRQVPAARLPSRQPLPPVIDPWRAGQATISPPPASSALLDRPLVAERAKRTKPEVLPIEDLRAVAGIAVLSDSGGPKPAGLPDAAAPGAGPAGEAGTITPFVVVTGLIPAAKQQREFDRRFSEAGFRDPQRDRPKWGVYLVERAVVDSGGTPRWEKVELKQPVKPGRNDKGDGQRQLPATEALPADFFLGPEESEAVYAAELPQRIDEPWAAAGLHPWFLARIAKALERPAPQERPAADAAVTLADLLTDARKRAGSEFRLAAVTLDAAPERQRSVGLYKFGVRTTAPPAEVPIGDIGLTAKPVFAISEAWGQELAVDGTTSRPRACNLRCRVELVGQTPVVRILAIELLDEAGRPGDTLSEPAPQPVKAAEGVIPAASPEPEQPVREIGPVENRLFRFIDTAVEPGQTYRYRVKFALRNPNVDLAARHLADEQDAKNPLLISEFSNETPPIRVPDPVVLLARTFDKDTKRKLFVKGDAVEVMILAPSEQTGNFALRSVLTDVGGLANVAPELNRPGDIRFFGEAVATDRLLVDTLGSQDDRATARSGEPAEPLEMLFRRPDGSFEVVAAAAGERQISRYGTTLFKPGTELPDPGSPERRERDTQAAGFRSKVEQAQKTIDYGFQIREGIFGADERIFVEQTLVPQLGLEANRGLIAWVRQRIRELALRGATTKPLFEQVNSVLRDGMLRISSDQTADPVVRVNAMLLVGELQGMDRSPWPGSLAPLAEAAAEASLPLAVRIAAVRGLAKQVAAAGDTAAVATVAGPVVAALVSTPPQGDPVAAGWLVTRAIDLMPTMPAQPAAVAAAARILAAEQADMDQRVRAAIAVGKLATPESGIDAGAAIGQIKSLATAALAADLDAANARRLERRLSTSGDEAGARGDGPAAPVTPVTPEPPPAGGGLFGGLGDGALGAAEPAPAVTDEHAVPKPACRRNAWRLHGLAEAVRPARSGTGLADLLSGEAAAAAADWASELRKSAVALDATPDEATLAKVLATLEKLAARPGPAADQGGPKPAEPATSPFDQPPSAAP
jgi:hypothetical protein